MFRSLLLALILTLFAVTAHAKEIRLVWEPSPTPSVAGYVLYYGQDAQEYEFRRDMGDTLTAEVEGLGKGTWFFAVTAYVDIEDGESDFSNTVEYTKAGIQIVDVVHDPVVKPERVQLTIEYLR